MYSAPPGLPFLRPTTKMFKAWQSQRMQKLRAKERFRLRYAVNGFDPSFVADFAKGYFRTDSAASDFDTAFTFARASTATYVDATGTLQTAASGEPRLGHHVWDGSQWVNEGLLIESESRTNLITHSEDFADASWIKLNATVDGSGNLTDTTSDAQHYVRFDLTKAASAIDYVLWADIEAGSKNFCYLQTQDGGSFARQYFNLSTGSLGTKQQSGITIHNSSITEVSDGIYRCAIWFTSGTGTSLLNYIVAALADNDTAYAGAGDVAIKIHRAQLEAGSTPSSYIPTTGSTATRAAETLTAPSSVLPWGSAVSIAMEGGITYADNSLAAEAKFFDWYAGASEYITANLATLTGRTGQVQFDQRDTVSGRDVVESGLTTYSPGILVPYSIASRHGSTFVNGSVDGTALTADETPTALPDLSSIDLSVAPTYMGTLRSVRIWAQDIGDAGTEAASA